LPPVESPRPTNTLSFPFNQRWLMSFWSTMFNSDKRFEPNHERSAEWNRGASGTGRKCDSSLTGWLYRRQ